MDYIQNTKPYYKILGVDRDSSVSQIRRAYRNLAMKWHPDRWTKNPSLAEHAKNNFQLIQEAYAVLSDQRKRTMYDAGLYDDANDEEEEDEGFIDFMQEMISLMDNVREERRIYSMEELQDMLGEMSGDDDFSGKSRSSKRVRYSSDRDLPVHFSGYGTTLPVGV